MAKLSGIIFILLTSSAAHTHSPASLHSVYPQDCFDVQVEEVVRSVVAPEHLMKDLSEVQRTVEGTLNTVWPGSKVKLFGSLATGLGAASSDLDLTVFFPQPQPGDVINLATTAFEASPHIYQDIHTRARLPAITFHFQPFNVTCDVNFKHEGSYESELLQYLLSLDQRAFKLAVVIKHWAKLRKLIKPKHLTSYCMMLMVIFYLQQISILPSVLQLQNGYPELKLESTNHYNVAFQRNYTVSRRNESLFEVFRGFFEFYERFDFEGSIICPFTGRVVKKMLFENIGMVPEEFSQYKINVNNNVTQPFKITSVCIQSLLILNDNCAWRVDNMKHFIDNFRSAALSSRYVNKCVFLKAIGIELPRNVNAL